MEPGLIVLLVCFGLAIVLAIALIIFFVLTEEEETPPVTPPVTPPPSPPPEPEPPIPPPVTPPPSPSPEPEPPTPIVTVQPYPLIPVVVDTPSGSVYSFPFTQRRIFIVGTDLFLAWLYDVGPPILNTPNIFRFTNNSKYVNNSYWNFDGINHIQNVGTEYCLAAPALFNRALCDDLTGEIPDLSPIFYRWIYDMTNFYSVNWIENDVIINRLIRGGPSSAGYYETNREVVPFEQIGNPLVPVYLELRQV
jgi:hypothetical protein